jgi:hypothetical protein
VILGSAGYSSLSKVVEMISKKCSVEEFVEAVKGKDSQEVIALAVEEATKADRKVMKTRKQGKTEKLQTYSRQLKRLINYHRYVVKPRFRDKTTYNLYMKYWGHLDQLPDLIPPNPPVDTLGQQKTV